MLDSMTGVEREAFAAAVVGSPELLEEHVRAGGTVGSFVEAWRAERAAKARAVEITPEIVQTILEAPLGEESRWNRPGATVRDYLIELLVQLWMGEADPEYGMVGDSDWEYDLYWVLLRLRLVPMWRDGYGLGGRDAARARELIVAAIRALGVVDNGAR